MHPQTRRAVLLALAVHLLLFLVVFVALDLSQYFHSPPAQAQIINAAVTPPVTTQQEREAQQQAEREARAKAEAERQRREQAAEEARRQAAAEAQRRKQAAEQAQRKAQAAARRKAEQQRKDALRKKLKALDCEHVISAGIQPSSQSEKPLKAHVADCWSAHRQALAKAAEAAQDKQAAQRAAQDQQRRDVEAEAKRKAKAQAEAKRKTQAEAKRKAEAERKAKAEARRKAEAARRAQEQAAIQQQMQAEMAAEQARLAAAQRAAEQAALDARLSSIAGVWGARVRAVVERKWIRPPSTLEKFSCEVFVRIDNDGKVVDAKVTRSSGDPVIDRSVITAVLKSSPLPLPEDRRVLEKYDHAIKFEFKPR